MACRYPRFASLAQRPDEHSGNPVTKPVQPVDVAVIGPGRMGGLYARLLRQSALTRLVAVCGRGDGRCQERRDGIERSVLHRRPLPRHALRASADRSGDRCHVRMGARRSRFGLPEFRQARACRKADGDVSFRCRPHGPGTADRNGVHLMVCHSLRFDPRFAAMREAVVRGDIGDVLHLYSRRSSQPAAVDRVLGRFPLAYWLLPHDIDLALWTSRSGVAPGPWRTPGPAGSAGRNLIVVVLTFDCGAVAVLENVWGSPTPAGRPAESALYRTRHGRGRRGPSVRKPVLRSIAPTTWNIPTPPSHRWCTARPRACHVR